MSPLAVAIATDTTTTPDTPPVTTPIATLRERFEWLSARPNGKTWELTEFIDGLEIEKGMTGRTAPPIDIQSFVIPQAAGAQITSIRHGVRELDVPLVAIGGDVQTLQYMLGEIARDFDPVAAGGATGILRHIDIDGAQSDLNCYCVGGLGFVGEGADGPNMHRETLIFQAYDPYWYREPVTIDFQNKSRGSMFPILPLYLSPSNVFGDTTFENVGDVEAYPLWTIRGPGNSATLTNKDTNETFTLVQTLSDGDTVTIDTSTGKVVGPDGSNWRKYLTTRQLWSLRSGLNHISLSMVGATESSEITISYRPRTLAP